MDSGRRRVVAFLASIVTIVSFLAGPGASVSSATQLTPAGTTSLDYPYLNALHFQPPLSNGPTGDPSQADTTLLDSIDVLYCKVSATGCAPIGEANSVLPGVDLLLLAGTDYTTTFSGTLHGVQNGDVVRVTVRVGGLLLGSTQLTANTLALLPSATQFSPLVPLLVRFRIDRNPVIRTRYLHEHGQTATQIAHVLMTEFGLDDVNQVLVLFNDLRVGDVSSTFAAPAAPAAPHAPTLPCLPGPSNPRQTFDPTQVTCAITNQLNAGDNLTQAASALAKGTAMSSAGPWSPPAIVSGLADQSNIPNVGPTQIYTALTQGNVLSPCTRTTDPSALGACQQVVNAFAGALKLDNSYLYNATDIVGLLLQIGFHPEDSTPLYNLLSHAVDASNPPKLRFSPTDVLEAFWTDGMPITVLSALKALAGDPPNCTGAPAADAVKNVRDAFSSMVVNQPGLVSELNMAQAALQVLCFPTADLLGALGTVYGDASPLGTLQTAAANLIRANCAAYDPANFAPGSLPDVLSHRQDQNVLLPANVASVLSAPAPGCQVTDMSKIAEELELAYFAKLASTGLTTAAQNQAIHIAAAMVQGVTNPAPTNIALLSALATALQNVPDSSTLECTATIGAAAASGGNRSLTGPSGQPGAGVLAALSDHSVESAVKDLTPFATTELRTLGKCLTENQIPIVYPLLKIGIQWSHYNGVMPVPGRLIVDGLITGRAGWQPSLLHNPDPLTADLPADLQAARVPNPVKVPNIGTDVPFPGKSLSDMLTLPSLAVRGPWNGSGSISSQVGFDVGSAMADPDFTNMSLSPDHGDFTMVVPAVPGTINLESVVYSYPNLADTPDDCTGLPGGDFDGHAESTAAAVVLPYNGGYQNLPNGQDDQIGEGTAQIHYTVVNNNNQPPGTPLVSEVQDITLHAGGASGACLLISSNDGVGHVGVNVSFDTDRQATGVSQLTAANGALDGAGSLRETKTLPLTSVSNALDGGFGTEEVLDAFPAPLDLAFGVAGAAANLGGTGNFFSLLTDSGIDPAVLANLNGTNLATLMTTGQLPS